MEEIGRVELRTLQESDYQELKDSMIAAYENWPTAYWQEADILKLLRIFPEGQLAVMIDGKVAGCSLSIIVKYDLFDDGHTYREITGDYTFDTHNNKGDVLYGIDTFIEPDYRGLRLGRRLYDARKELCEQLNLKSIVFGGRIPRLIEYPDLSPREYI